jgi:uncharacterized membrane protein
LISQSRGLGDVYKRQLMYNETFSRSVLKTLTSRPLFIMVYLLASYCMFGSIDAGVSVAIASITVNMVMYLGFERAWNWSHYGKHYDKRCIFSDTWKRTLYKLVTWRLFIFGNNVLMTYIIFGKIETVAMYASISILANSLIYIVHDRAWNMVKWGRKLIVNSIDTPSI